MQHKTFNSQPKNIKKSLKRSQELVTISLRVPKDLAMRLRKVAQTERRTVSGQAVLFLESKV
jgi:hypothetical protein